MKLDRKEYVDCSGNYNKKEVDEITKDDGWVEENKLYMNNHSLGKVYFKGVSKNLRYETDNPKITRTFTIIFSSIAIIVGLVLLICGILFKNFYLIFFGIIVLMTAISFLITSQKTINNKEKEKKIK